MSLPQRSSSPPLHWTAGVLPALLGPAQVGVFGVWALYAANRDEMVIGFEELLPEGLGVALAAGLLLLLPALLLRGAARARWVAVCLVFGLLLWIQGNFLLADYGELDGTELESLADAGARDWELGLWLTAFAAALWAGQRLARVAPFVAGSLLLVQSLAAGGAMLAGGGGSPDVAWAEPPAGLFELSAERNVLHLVLDAFQSDVLLEALAEDDGLARRFDGFTFFADHAGAFPTTAVSMTAMLTGRIFDNREPIGPFRDRALAEHSVLDRFRSAGFRVDAAVIAPRLTLGNRPHRVADVFFRIPVPFVGREDHRRFVSAQMLELSLFRHLPHRWKGWIYDGGRWKLQRRVAGANRRYHAASGRAFLEAFGDALRTGAEAPVYKLIHVGLPHLPAVFDAACGALDGPSTEIGAYRDQVRCAIRVLAELLERLEASGVYDETFVVVSADHGVRQAPLAAPGAASIPGFDGPYLGREIGSAMALFLVKPLGARGPLQVSEAPTSMVDLPSTLLAGVGLDPSGYSGVDAMALPPEVPRERHFGYYTWARDDWRQHYFDALHRFVVRGPVSDPRSWGYRDTVLATGASLELASLDLTTPDSSLFVGPGWGSPRTTPNDEPVRFASGSRATLFALLPPSAATLRFESWVPASIHPQEIEVWVDGRWLGETRSRTAESFEAWEVELPADPERPTRSTIELRFTQRMDRALPVAAGFRRLEVSLQPEVRGSSSVP